MVVDGLGRGRGSPMDGVEEEEGGIGLVWCCAVAVVVVVVVVCVSVVQCIRNLPSISTMDHDIVGGRF